ncbi:MAG: STAS domain-containing protein [Clostridia bacterium]|nr:STAS domain-containing protein [Clostridia bacterium]
MKYKYIDIENKLLIELNEEIDIDTCTTLRSVVDGYILKYNPRECELDMEKVNFMDSSGIGFIAGRYNLAKMLGCDLVIKKPNASIRKLLEMSSISKNIKVV